MYQFYIFQYNYVFNGNVSKIDKCLHLVSAGIVRIRKLYSFEFFLYIKIGFLSAISPTSMLKNIVTEQGFNINPSSDLGGAEFNGLDRFCMIHSMVSLLHLSFTSGRHSLAEDRHVVLRIFYSN